MITQEFTIRCQAPSAWIDPSAPATFHTQGEDKVCNGTQTIEATSPSDAKRTFQRRGWHVSEDGRTYCGMHSETARRLDTIAREKARSSP